MKQDIKYLNITTVLDYNIKLEDKRLKEGLRGRARMNNFEDKSGQFQCFMILIIT